MFHKRFFCLVVVTILIVWYAVSLAGTVSDEAKRFMTRGMAAVEMAKTPKDYERAVREFEKAAQLAPDWPDVYFNLGSVQAKAGNYGESMRNYKRYLELAPNAPDAAKVRDEIIKLEYRAEQQVKVSELGRDGRFIAYDNGTVLDTKTKLIWAARDNSSDIKWADAKSYCENYNGGDYTDWRMPTQNELAGLYDAGKSRTMPCNTSFSLHVATELIDMSCLWSWASETRGFESATINFVYGSRLWTPQSHDVYGRVRPVRSGK